MHSNQQILWFRIGVLMVELNLNRHKLSNRREWFTISPRHNKNVLPNVLQLERWPWHLEKFHQIFVVKTLILIWIRKKGSPFATLGKTPVQEITLIPREITITMVNKGCIPVTMHSQYCLLKEKFDSCLPDKCPVPEQTELDRTNCYLSVRIRT